MKKHVRFISLFLSIITILTLLCSCGKRPLAQGKLAGEVVGTVTGGSKEYEIYYEEFYALAKEYYDVAKSKYGDDKEKINAEVWDTLNEKIIINSGILELCSASGLEYNEEELRDNVTSFLENEALANYDDDYSAYLEAYEEKGLTDHYRRFIIGVDILYQNLAIQYQKEGKIPNSDEKMTDYIKDNFIHTWHITIYVDENDNYDDEKARAEKALSELKNGTSMFKLIGGAYNEDPTLDSLNGTYGHYFKEGVCPWGNDYEKVAKELKNNQSCKEIIATKGVSPKTGKTVDCFYIIEKLPVLTSEINNNFEELSDTVKTSILAEKLSEKLSTLKFEANEYAKSLDFANLEKPENGVDYQLIIMICVLAGSAIILIVGIFVYRTLRAKKFQKNLKQRKEKSKKN